MHLPLKKTSSDAQADFYALDSSKHALRTEETESKRSSSGRETQPHLVASASIDSIRLNDETRSIVHDVLGADAHLAAVAIPYEHLRLQEMIGAGVYGEVIRASYQSAPVIVKRMPKNGISERSIRVFRDEIGLMMHLQHPNIVRFIGASWNSPSRLCFVMEFLQRGDLYHLLRNPKYKLSWCKKLQIAIHAARGMSYLHTLDTPIIHRDLKSMNIHVSSSYVAKISDFALSRERSVEETMSITGTPLWMAPEMIRGERYDEKADHPLTKYTVLSELDTGKTPYHELTTKKKANDKILGVSALVRKVAFEDLRPTLTPDCMPSLQALFLRCVGSDAAARPSFNEVLDILERDVQHDVNERFPGGDDTTDDL
ncbi:Aste57867_2447 [Aphanomyces stellatus]|uniref:Aste57867_2447 protein n=1 Tax=Aphanomyces stellatus TaxID=120398 RepID=A0A485K7K1_9STRA|nr:hypothetical protein As57867_002441 [Aphanomyces stellatus]VFT79647.1 Aste57867_2447 [Aphanomyces stellatus]